MIDSDRIREIKAFLADVRPGPWQWIGNTKMRDVSLATTHSGHVYVMDFVRWGMGGAQPRFQVELNGSPGFGVMRSLQELTEGGGGLGVKYAAEHRKHFAGIAHPDARFIAESRSLVDELLAEVERLRSFIEELHPDGCEYDDQCPSDARHYACFACKSARALGAVAAPRSSEVAQDDDEQDDCACAMGHVPDEAREELEECRRLGRPCPWCAGRVTA